MASQADVRTLDRALRKLSAHARGDLMALLRGRELTASARYALKVELGPLWLDLVASYGELSSALGAEAFEAMADAAGVRPVAKMVRSVDEQRALDRMAWALSTPNVAGNLAVLLDELVKQPARSTIMSSSHLSGGAWARVPLGDTCAFCLMLGSRGAVYKTDATAGKGRKYHGDCNCSVVFVRDDEDYPEGYDPEGMYQQYLDARSAAESGNTKRILSKLREQQDSN